MTARAKKALQKGVFGYRHLLCLSICPMKRFDMRTTLVLATRNRGKIDEIRSLLSKFAIDIKSLDDFGPLAPIHETGTTFDENAYLKASATARMLGLPALADDSGLVVEALDGAPGVYSARYAGPEATDKANCDKLLAAMAGRTDRQAAFCCVISIAVPTGPALTYEGRCEGRIAEAPAGQAGFGYDPLFFYPPLNKTFAQLSLAEKNQVSHRGQALREMQAEFDKILVWIDQHMPVFEKAGCQGCHDH